MFGGKKKFADISVLILTTRRRMTKWRYSSTHFKSWKKLEITNQTETSITFTQNKGPSLFTTKDYELLCVYLN